MFDSATRRTGTALGLALSSAGCGMLIAAVGWAQQTATDLTPLTLEDPLNVQGTTGFVLPTTADPLAQSTAGNSSPRYSGWSPRSFNGKAVWRF